MSDRSDLVQVVRVDDAPERFYISDGSVWLVSLTGKAFLCGEVINLPASDLELCAVCGLAQSIHYHRDGTEPDWHPFEEIPLGSEVLKENLTLAPGEHR